VAILFYFRGEVYLKTIPFFFGGNIFSVCSEAKLCLLFVARDVSLPFFSYAIFFCFGSDVIVIFVEGNIISVSFS